MSFGEDRDANCFLAFGNGSEFVKGRVKSYLEEDSVTKKIQELCCLEEDSVTRVSLGDDHDSHIIERIALAPSSRRQLFGALL